MNAKLTVEEKFDLALKGLSRDQVLSLKIMVQNPPDGIKPDQEAEGHRELRQVIWNACRHITL